MVEELGKAAGNESISARCSVKVPELEARVELVQVPEEERSKQEAGPHQHLQGPELGYRCRSSPYV